MGDQEIQVAGAGPLPLLEGDFLPPPGEWVSCQSRPKQVVWDSPTLCSGVLS